MIFCNSFFKHISSFLKTLSIAFASSIKAKPLKITDFDYLFKQKMQKERKFFYLIFYTITIIPKAPNNANITPTKLTLFIFSLKNINE